MHDKKKTLSHFFFSILYILYLYIYKYMYYIYIHIYKRFNYITYISSLKKTFFIKDILSTCTY